MYVCMCLSWCVLGMLMCVEDVIVIMLAILEGRLGEFVHSCEHPLSKNMRIFVVLPQNLNILRGYHFKLERNYSWRELKISGYYAR